jgi:hypothetical protein
MSARRIQPTSFCFAQHATQPKKLFLKNTQKWAVCHKMRETLMDSLTMSARNRQLENDPERCNSGPASNLLKLKHQNK